VNEETPKRLAVLCVHTPIEDIHAGIEPYSPSGDFSGVKVVTPTGEIPWPKVSGVRNDEMRIFMKQVVDRLYTVLCDSTIHNSSSASTTMRARMTRAWDAPKDLPDWFI
jgi:hypothetical protein